LPRQPEARPAGAGRAIASDGPCGSARGSTSASMIPHAATCSSAAPQQAHGLEIGVTSSLPLGRKTGHVHARKRRRVDPSGGSAFRRDLDESQALARGEREGALSERSGGSPRSFDFLERSMFCLMYVFLEVQLGALLVRPASLSRQPSLLVRSRQVVERRGVGRSISNGAFPPVRASRHNPAWPRRCRNDTCRRPPCGRPHARVWAEMATPTTPRRSISSTRA